MKSFTSGLIAGGAIGFTAIAWMLSDTKTRKRMMRDSKMLLNKMDISNMM